MPLVSTRSVLEIAERKNFALPAFNVSNLEFMVWCLEQAQEMDYPIIVQIAPVEYRPLDIKAMASALEALSQRYSIPFSLHLDHAHEIKEVMEAIQSGFSSVMIDGSRLPFVENIKLTRSVVELAHMVGVSVEGEIGRVGGLEGDEHWETEGSPEDFLTTPEEAEGFVAETGVDSLAVAVGTRHGLYLDRPPKLDLDRIRAIKNRLSIPLVIHGGSGTPEDQLQAAVRLGIRKINFSTVLRVAFVDGLKDYFSLHPDELFIPKIMQEIAPKVKNAVKSCIIASFPEYEDRRPCGLGRTT
ncbi:MAG: fructose-bisphosphate aldolase, class [Candidatus Atribacteria bacterium]|nr:fructose-bisphosphate aldolase, class [Candidatus Atribacteria bacterium]